MAVRHTREVERAQHVLVYALHTRPLALSQCPSQDAPNNPAYSLSCVKTMPAVVRLEKEIEPGSWIADVGT